MKTRTATMKSREHFIFMSLFGLCLALIGVYMYFLSASIMHVVVRMELEQKVGKLQSEISQLESDYIAVQHKVSADIASMQGYAPSANKVFIDRSAPSLVLNSDR